MALQILFKTFVTAALLYLVFPPTAGQYYDYADYLVFDYFSDDVSPRIIGGRPARQGEAFYQLALFLDGDFNCGATLVSAPTYPYQQIALTSASCVCPPGTINPYYPKRVEVHGEALILYDFVAQIRKAKKIIRHPSFNGFEFNLAIVFLESPFLVSQTFGPIKLPEDEFADEDIKRVTVSGWGDVVDGGENPEELNIVTIPIIRTEECLAWFKEIDKNAGLPEGTFCAGREAGGLDACNEDGGGPAVAKRGAKPLFLMGVVSFGYRCGEAKSPGVYTRVSQFLDWIGEKTASYGG